MCIVVDDEFNKKKRSQIYIYFFYRKPKEFILFLHRKQRQNKQYV